MNKLLTSLLTGAAAVAAALTLVPAPVSAATPVPYWDETTAGLAVNGTYRSVVGDFAEGPTDDIVWNSNSTATDHLWTSDGARGFAKQALTLQPPAGAIPLVGDFVGDAHEDIFWYGPGSAPDATWMASGGSFRAATARVNGTYDAKVLDDATGKDSIVFYDRAGGRGSIWAFGDRGAFADRAFTAPAGAQLVVGRFSNDGCADAYWYAQTGRDPLWEMDCEGRTVAVHPQTLVGDATLLVGQFSPGRDSQDDILWVDRRGEKTLLAENLTAGAFTRSRPPTPYTGTLLRVANGYGAVHQWDPTTGRHHIWFRLPGGTTFNADLTNTPIPSGYQPIVGSFVGRGEDILWYAPGAAVERLFSKAG